MADDGMLLNFELPSDAFTPKPSQFKGGRWKDRLTARKSEEWGRSKAQERARGKTPNYGQVVSDEDELIHADAPAAKRLKTRDAEVVRPSFPRPEPRAGGRPASQREALPKSTNGEVISSLFTYNPETKVPASAPAEVNDIQIVPSNAPLSDELATFTNLGLSTTLASHLLNKMDIQAPTAIQRRSLQQLCAEDRDAFIQAETGSGKTLAYLLPIVQRISAISKEMKAAGQGFNRKSGLFGMVLVPTRELAKQITAVLERLLSCCHWIVGGIVIGGESKSSEKARLRKGVNILVATPGRLVDHFDNTEVLDLSKVRWLVLDEGDRLMELGFDNDIQKIVSVLNLRSRKSQEVIIPGLPDRRTTILCSATIEADVERLKSIALKDPVLIAVESSDRTIGEGETVKKQGFSAPAQLKQSYAIVPAKQRLVTLVAVLRQAFKRKGMTAKCIVFMSCADSVDFHFEALANDPLETIPDATASDEIAVPKQSRTNKIPQGDTIAESRTQASAKSFSSVDDSVKLFRLHGSMQQATRTSTLKAFSACVVPAVLVCTDVASRGLDLPNVDLVIEYDPPFSREDHVHRIGRTARAGKDGRAMIFLQPGCEEAYVEVLAQGQPHTLTRHTGDELLKKGFAATSGVVVGREWEDRATDWQIGSERWAIESPKHLEQARRAYQSHIRAYTTHVAAERAIFDIKQLHLGHLAKAFALRDKPGSIRVPGSRPGKEASGKNSEARKKFAAKHAAKRTKDAAELDVPNTTDEREARKRMRVALRARGGASEFNLG
nr:hypothetical protein B0A51_02233 [Rachicladosporium sp. CCFEE 5018]